jgi:hypothetical protein
MKDYPTAQVYYKVSVEAAQEAENNVIWAIGLGRMSSLPMYNGQSQEALPLLQEAQRLASTYAAASTRAWLASIEAEAHAHLTIPLPAFGFLSRLKAWLNKSNQKIAKME